MKNNIETGSGVTPPAIPADCFPHVPTGTPCKITAIKDGNAYRVHVYTRRESTEHWREILSTTGPQQLAAYLVALYL